MENNELKIINHAFVDEVWFNEFNGKPLTELIDSLLLVNKQAIDKGFSNIYIDSDDTDGYITILGSRLETELEQKARIEREKVAAYRATQEEKREYKLFLRLKAKFEPETPD